MKFLAIALFICASTVCATASSVFAYVGSVSSSKNEEQQDDEGAPLTGYGSPRPRTDALKGIVIDLMQTKEGTSKLKAEMKGNVVKRKDEKPPIPKEELWNVVGKLDNGWIIQHIEKFHPSSRGTSELYTTSIFLANKRIRSPEYRNSLYPNTIQPKAFDRLTKNGEYRSPLNNSGFLCYYEGEFGVPEDGEYRFVGNVSGGVMLVGVEKKTVFYAFEPKKGYGFAIKKCGPDWEPEGYCGENGDDGIKVTTKDLYKGSWLQLKKNKPYHIQIAFGSERVFTEVKLGVQRKDRDTDDNFPVFALEKVKTYSKEIEEMEEELTNLIDRPISLKDPERGKKLERREELEEELKSKKVSYTDSLFETGPYNTSCVFNVQEQAKVAPKKKTSKATNK